MRERNILTIMTVIVFGFFVAVWFVSPVRCEPPRRPAFTYAELVGGRPGAGEVAMRRRPCDAACRRALVLPLAPPAPATSPTPHPVRVGAGQ